MMTLRTDDEPDEFRRATTSRPRCVLHRMEHLRGPWRGVWWLRAGVVASWVRPAVMFVGLVAMGVAKRSHLVAIAVGSVACYATLGLPNKLSIVVGGVAGVIAGTLADRFDA
ncbi:MAG: hypothetical protein R2706_03715 [Acidimicrobiales bacterium]